MTLQSVRLIDRDSCSAHRQHYTERVIMRCTVDYDASFDIVVAPYFIYSMFRFGSNNETNMLEANYTGTGELLKLNK